MLILSFTKDGIILKDCFEVLIENLYFYVFLTFFESIDKIICGKKYV
jgi:hypothetical protein